MQQQYNHVLIYLDNEKMLKRGAHMETFTIKCQLENKQTLLSKFQLLHSDSVGSLSENKERRMWITYSYTQTTQVENTETLLGYLRLQVELCFFIELAKEKRCSFFTIENQIFCFWKALKSLLLIKETMLRRDIKQGL